MLSNIKPILSVAKFYGCPPHKIVGNKLIITKWGIINLILISITTIFAFKYSISLDFYNGLIPAFYYIIVLRKTFLLICILSDGIITILKNDQLLSALDHLQFYDVSSKFNNKTHYLTVNCCRVMLVIVVIYGIMHGCLTYFWGNRSLHLDGIILNFHTVIMSLQILKFCSFMWLLYRRFNHLSEIIMPKGKSTDKIIY